MKSEESKSIAMTNSINKTVGALTILSGIGAAACLAIGVIAVQYNFDAFANPALLLSLPNVSLVAVRWFMLSDMFGYYLLLLPAIFYVHGWMKEKTPWAQLITFCGASYVLIGSMGAAILAVVWPSILSAYPTATASMQEILRVNFQTVTDIVYGGMWNHLEVLLGGTWWLFLGVMLRREKKALGLATIVLGLSALLDGVGEVLQIGSLAEVGLNLYLILGVLWPIWFGISLMRKPL